VFLGKIPCTAQAPGGGEQVVNFLGGKEGAGGPFRREEALTAGIGEEKRQAVRKNGILSQARKIGPSRFRSKDRRFLAPWRKMDHLWIDSQVAHSMRRATYFMAMILSIRWARSVK
jgi:hypothetical protein